MPAKLTRSLIVRTVAWRDLVPMRKADGVVECLHPLPWLAASLGLAAHGWFVAALPCTFMFFLTGLRLNHEAIHGNIGFTAQGDRLVLHTLSMLMLCSNHSVRWNHLQHHRHIGQEHDLEGKAGRMTFWQVLLYGPLFAWETHRQAWLLGGEQQRRLMALDLGLNLVLPALAVLLPAPALQIALAYHLAMMASAQCLTAFFAVWITHHGCDDRLLVARSQRNRLVNFAAYSMFFHFEHHTFPAVPVRRLNQLARRLDAAFPGLVASIDRVVPGAR